MLPSSQSSFCLTSAICSLPFFLLEKKDLWRRMFVFDVCVTVCLVGTPSHQNYKILNYLAEFSNRYRLYSRHTFRKKPWCPWDLWIKSDFKYSLPTPSPSLVPKTCRLSRQYDFCASVHLRLTELITFCANCIHSTLNYLNSSCLLKSLVLKWTKKLVTNLRFMSNKILWQVSSSTTSYMEFFTSPSIYVPTYLWS